MLDPQAIAAAAARLDEAETSRRQIRQVSLGLSRR